MNSSSLELSVVVLDVDRTLIRSVRKETSINPHPYYSNQYVEGYFHFTLNCEPKRSNSVSSGSSALISSKTHSHSSTKSSSPPSSPSTLPTNYSTININNGQFFKRRPYEEHYHVYIRPGLKKLMTYLHYLSLNTNVKIVIASMAKRDYVDNILKGLKKHCTDRKFPKFECVLTRQSWDENLSPSSTPTYPISVLLEQYAKHGLTKPMNLRFKSIQKIGRVLGIDNDINKIKNILVIDDDMGYYDHEDRVSGQIYQIPAWNGPVNYRRNTRNINNITIYQQNDNELPSLGAMIQAIVDKGSIQKYLFTRVLSVFRHEYGSKYKKQMKLRKDMINILMTDIGMEIDEDTAISSLWIFDNILRCCSKQKDVASLTDIEDVDGEYIEILFGCIIVYQMYIYDVHPSAHFYRLSFTQNEFWKQVMDVFFEYYVRLLFHIKDSRIQFNHQSMINTTKNTTNTTTKTSKTSKQKNDSLTKPIISNKPNKPKYAAKFVNKFINQNMSQLNTLNTSNIATNHPLDGKGETDKNCLSSSGLNKRKSIKSLKSSCSKCKFKHNSASFNCINHVAPIEVAQSEPESINTTEAQEEVIINNNNNNNNNYNNNNNEIISLSSSDDDITPTPSISNRSENIILTQQTYKSIQDNLKVLVKSISKSIFCKNLSPVCFIGYNLLSASRSNPVPKCISKYQRILKKVYRDRNKFDL